MKKGASMKNTALGFIAAAMAFVANISLADVGAIRSIDPCDSDGNLVSPGTIDSAFTVGETAYFRIRLENLNSAAIYQSRQSLASEQLSNPWRFEYFEGGTAQDSAYVAQQMAINPPKVGVYVSGRFTLAAIDKIGESAKEPWFTDIVCSYTVKPGDLALPLTLANSAGNEAADSATTEYFLGIGRNFSSPWRLVSYAHDSRLSWDVITSTNYCQFSYGNYGSWGEVDGSLPSSVTEAAGNKTVDRTLFNAGIFVKSIDFDSNAESDAAGNPVWRAVHERSTSTKEFVPSLAIPGELAGDYSGSVYLWTADTNSVVLPDAQYVVGSTRVLKLTIDGSDASLQFRLRGVTRGTSTELFLSSTLTNITSASGRTITNFVSRTVACLDPLAPTVTVLANGASACTINATSDYTNTIPFKVELTQAWTADDPVEVKLKYEVNGEEAIPDGLIAISASQEGGYTDGLPLSVTIPSGETESTEDPANPKALYALGALTSGVKGDRIVVTPYFDDPAMAAYFTVKPLTLTVYGTKPEIVSVNGYAPADIASSATNSALSIRGGVETVFEVRVSDTYRNMFGLDGTNGAFKVTWQYEGGAKIVIDRDADGNPLVPDEDGVLYVPVSYPVPSADQNMNTTIKVTNSDGRTSERAFYVYVRQPKNVSAAISAPIVGEGGVQSVTFTLSETASASSLYAYLEPANDAARNLSYAAFFTTNTVDEAARGSAGRGVPFSSGALAAVSDALTSGNGLRFYDNDSGHFVYNIKLCSSEVWNPASRITEFTENTLVIDVTNNFPVITEVRARNNATAQDKLATDRIVMSLSDPMRTFRVSQLSDVDADKAGADAAQVVYSWEVRQKDDSGKYPEKPNLVYYTVGLDSTLDMKDMFGTDQLDEAFCGEYQFSVRAQDKDMRGNKPDYLYYDGAKWVYDPWKGLDMSGTAVSAYPEGDSLNPGNDWGDAYVFELQIDRNPYVDTNPYGTFTSGSDGVPVFTEGDLLAGEPMGFSVGLNSSPNITGFGSVQVEVAIEALDNSYAPAAADTDVAPEISKREFKFTRNAYSNSFAFVGFDGTYLGRGLVKKPQLYRLVAKVTSTGASPSGTPWNELYTVSTNYFRLQNTKPAITVDPDYEGQDTETNAMMGVTYAPNEHFNFRWSVSDVDGDLVASNHGSTNLLVTCAVIGGHEIGTVTNESSGIFSVWFETPGINKLKITATDKDGDVASSKVIWFFVETSKNVFLYPYGPSVAAVDSDAIAKYLTQPGRGVGRVWADGNFGSITSFRHTWTYGTSSRSASVYGQGYAAGETDESTSVGKSSAPNETGDGTDAPHYRNDSLYDSFFYRWFKYVPSSDSSSSSSSSSSGSSSETTWTAGSPAPGRKGETMITLPSTQTEYTYPDTMALAIFSREKYVADNMGDINADGIPDAYAVRTWTSDAGETARLCEIVSGGSAEGGEGDEGEVSDADLADISAYNGDLDFFPAAAGSANPLKPTTLDWGPGVPFDALYEIRGMHSGLNEPGVSDYDLSEAERYALLSDFVSAGNSLTGVAAADYVAATNWATGAKWTPEAWQEGGVRLNPAKADTDGDGFSDGWEYYFWYYAKVGAVTNGVWGRLEGRRYSIASPASSARIAPEEIAAAFNPLERGSIDRDTDNDGLTDLEEFALGTNPVDWDSDGDGVNDLWEVMNGLDPLNAKDGADNPDCDFMARCEYDGDTFTVYTFSNGEIFALPTKTSPTFTADPVSVSTNVYRLTVSDASGDVVYYSVEAAQHDGAALTADAQCFQTVKIGDVVYLANLEPVTVAAGTAVNAAETSDAAEEATVASAYYLVKRIAGAKTEDVWCAAKPALVGPNGLGQLMLAVDTACFGTYEHDDGSLYLGESITLPAGTPVAAVSDAPAQMTQVRVMAIGAGLVGPSGGFTWRNPVTLETESTAKALPLFNYGGDGVTYVPCGTNAAHYAAAPVRDDPKNGVERPAVSKVEKKHKVTLVHNQVFSQYGFDPRVAWNINANGYVDVRWEPTTVSENGLVTSASQKGEAGLAVRTAPYTSRDEYLVMQYRQQMRKIGSDGSRSETESLLHGGDAYLVAEGAPTTIAYMTSATTYPNLPVTFVREQYAARSEVSPFDNSTNRTVVSYWEWLEQEHDVHGADTDYDGIPDGWELYVNSDPNNHDDATLASGWADDKDALTLLAEYAGVDSCNAYTNRFDMDGAEIFPEAESITKNNPGKTLGWWNKFFPTNPYDMDTDGDGVKDDAEGSSWSDTLYVGRSEYSGTFSFIYGKEENAEKYALDGTTTCFRGGGLNPCTVDTDGDLLPDAWEFQFAGIVFKDGKPETDPGLSATDLATLTEADGKQSAVSETGYAIRGGMDGTWNGDPCLDFDHDGLVNCQEYLVQSLRHLRYDDPSTPLMGLDPSTVQALSSPENGILTDAKFVKFIPFSAWDGEAFHKRCLANGFTGLSTWRFSELGYFTLPPHEWDPLRLNTQGQSACANYEKSEGAGYRVMLPPLGFLPTSVLRYYVNGAMRYATTDPRRWDSDNDGMDDYYELFHGLNPLLGSAVDPSGENEYGFPNLRYDVIASIHNGKITSWSNYWTGWPTDLVQPAFDAIRYPWMIGTMECDADGDGLRNDEESIKANVTSPQYTHTDPTPLWMTDSTSGSFASFTSQYYNPDPYVKEVEGYDPLTSYPDIFGFPWDDMKWSLRLAAYGMGGRSSEWMFAFEENEGFDTDHDFRRDSTELTRGLEATSDPLDFTDPDCRQALYLPGLVDGVGSAAATRNGEFRRAAATEPDLLKQFTVECWVRPDGAASDAVILERVCNYGASTLSNATSAIRANFRIGVDASGRLYGEFEGSTLSSASVRATGAALEDGKWTHVAFAFDGSKAALYVNGSMSPVASVSGAGVLPANGVDGILQDAGLSAMAFIGYRTLPCSFVLGAKTLGAGAFTLGEETSWDDYGSFFRGWIDEVRVWDGARSAADINADYLKRYTLADVSALRDSVYRRWLNGATRNGGDGSAALPAELLQHYSFTTLPGAAEASSVMTEPTGFQAAVMDNVRRPNGKTLDSFLRVGWWDGCGVKSEVYLNHAIVPWIGNTVAHLPFMDGSCADSQYWSEHAAGVASAYHMVLAGLQNAERYEFPNSANPYPYYFYNRDRFNHYMRLYTAPRLAVTASSSIGDFLARRYEFQLRSDFVGTSDLVPLGGAFARRGTDYWDGQGAMDAWAETTAAGEVLDANGNSIPDWAEALGYTTVEAYLRALAEGLLPSGAVDSAYASKADSNGDGVKDWWQKMYGLDGIGRNDQDMDGLADWAEYLVSEVFKFGTVDPTKPMTNGKEYDYFRRAGRLYLGELFSDHDFMEDWWEDRFSDAYVTAGAYDAHRDNDADGWSNYAECRAGTMPDRTAKLMAGGESLAEYPVPMIKAKLFCKDAEDISAPIVVKAYSDSSLRKADATWTIPGSSETKSMERMLGLNPATGTLTANLGPGYVVPGSVNILFRDMTECKNDGTGSLLLLNPASTEWHQGLVESVRAGNVETADIVKLNDSVGTISYKTGELTLNLSDLTGYAYYISSSSGESDSDDGSGVYTFYRPSVSNEYSRIDLSKSYMKVTWDSIRVAGESEWEYSLSEADSGHVREGKNTFVAFVDLDSNGVWSDGEPMGVVSGVDVGWSGASLELEMTAESPVCSRPTLSFVSTNETDSASSESATNGMVYVYRYLLDAYATVSAVTNRMVAGKEVLGRDYLHEGDFLSDGNLDIDWNYFQSEVMKKVNLNYSPVTSVTYRVYSEPVNVVQEIKTPSGRPYIEFSREFGRTQAKGVPVSAEATEAVFYGARPTFRWSIAGDRPDTYTAFAIQVKDSAGKVVWNSGKRRLPPRNVAGAYEWTPPLYVDDQTSLGAVFRNLANYTWQVSVYNSKFQSDSWSDARTFRMNAYGEDEVNAAGKFTLEALVKYYGPGAVSALSSKTPGILRVEAFTTPDFTGDPAGRAFVADLSSVTNVDGTVNARIRGLDAGTYYVRAYLDSDGDFEKDQWESWGYLCARASGEASGTIFTPLAVTLGYGVNPGVAKVYVEDADTDQDCLPDVYEYDVAGTSKANFLEKKNVSTNANNGYITVNPNLESAISALVNGGMPVQLASVASRRMSASLASLISAVDTVEPSIKGSTLTVTSLGLADGVVSIAMSAEAEDPLAGSTLFVSDGKVRATLVVKYSDSLGGEWSEVREPVEFAVEDGAVDAVFTKALSDLGLDASRGFFKVEIEQ